MRLNPDVVFVCICICASKWEEFSLARAVNVFCTVLTGTDLMKASGCTYAAELGNTVLTCIHCLTV